ncbi:uncharacterized protein LOC142902405 [Nelusetta ayraudi]|uniref:uncharacterized protein LOC142902405 n=1 Tax=Nelusetta ayraudi TaxID=303726 RepID=UPI003F6FEE6B
MGSCCCHNESPCGSAEERSVLLKGDAKATAWTGMPVVVGACGPQDVDDGLRVTPDESNAVAKVAPEAVQVKKRVEVEAPSSAITQENGPMKELDMATAAPSPRRESKLAEKSATARDEDEEVGLKDDKQTGLLQCTLNSPQEKKQDSDNLPEANTAPEDTNAASARDERLDLNRPLLVEAAGLENHTGIEAAAAAAAVEEEQSPSATHAVDQGMASKMDPAHAEAPASCQSPFASLVSEEVESLSCATTHGLEEKSSSAPEEPACDPAASPDICDLSSGSDPTASDRSGEEQGPAPCAGEPVTAAGGDASERTEPDQDARPDPPCVAASSANTSLDAADEAAPKGEDGGAASKAEVEQEVVEEDKEEVEEDKEEKEKVVVVAEVKKEVEEEEKKEAVVAEVKEEEAEEVRGTPTGDGSDGESREAPGKEEQPAGKSPSGVEGDGLAASGKEALADGGLGSSEEDLYRGAEELSAGPPPPTLSEDSRCSLDPAMDVLSYSEREWRGNTAKSALIRKGYQELSQKFGSLRRVRGDNYCALRATLFQVLSHSTQPPSWLQEDHFATLPERLEAQEGLISQWRFPGECLGAEGTVDATLKLQGYVEQLWSKWRAAADCPSAAERRRLCERSFQGGEGELGLLEALKLLMLGRAVQLHGQMSAGADVPLFCWLLFARDSSECPRSFLANHLGRVGLGAGLEQVEMFLLGYALQCTIQVYRLYKADTEEFVTYYPDDHRDEWPCVCLVTEDDRHYNVPVVEAVAAAAAADTEVELS